MTTYALDHPEQGHIEYTDKKRYLWLSSVIMPIFPWRQFAAETRNTPNMPAPEEVVRFRSTERAERCISPLDDIH